MGWYVVRCSQEDWAIYYLVSDSVIKVIVLTKNQLLPQDLSIKSQLLYACFKFLSIGAQSFYLSCTGKRNCHQKLFFQVSNFTYHLIIRNNLLFFLPQTRFLAKKVCSNTKIQYKLLCRLLGYFFEIGLKTGHDRPVTLTKAGVFLKGWASSSIYL